MSVEETTDSGSVLGLGTPVAPAAAVEGSVPVVGPSETPEVVLTREQTEIEKREAFDKAYKDDMMKVWEKNHQPRAQDGKFAPKTETTETPETTTEVAATETSPDQAPKVKDEPAKPAIDPPLSWSADMKAKWAALPPDVQAYAAQRDKETHDAITRNGQQVKEYEQKVKAYEPFDQLVSAYGPDFAKRGVSAPQMFAVLLDAQRKLDTDPRAGLVQIGLSYGIDLRPVFQGQGAPQQTLDPRIAQLEAQLREVSGKLSAQESKTVEQEKSAYEKQINTLTQSITDFAKDKPYWADVESDVMQEVQVLKNLNPERPPLEILSEAYKRATWANDDVRERIQTDQRKADEDKRKVEAEAKARVARAAASVNVKSGSPGNSSPSTMDDTLKGLATKFYGRSAA